MPSALEKLLWSWTLLDIWYHVKCIRDPTTLFFDTEVCTHCVPYVYAGYHNKWLRDCNWKLLCCHDSWESRCPGQSFPHPMTSKSIPAFCPKAEMSAYFNYCPGLITVLLSLISLNSLLYIWNALQLRAYFCLKRLSNRILKADYMLVQRKCPTTERRLGEPGDSRGVSKLI